MPPIPFPFPIKVGNDICSVQRIFNALAHRSHRHSIRFVDKILTPKETAQKSKPISESVDLWWGLQQQRWQIRAGFNLSPSKPTAHDERSHTWPVIDGYRPTFQPMSRTSEDPSVSGFKGNGAAGGALSPEASNDGTLGNGRNGGHIDATESEPLNEPLRIVAEASAAKDPLDSSARVARVGRDASDMMHNVEREGAEIISATEGTGEEVEATTLSEKKRKEAMVSRTKQLDHEIQRVYPEMWSIAQFLAGRFAAKEAIIKAHEARRLTYHDIQILKTVHHTEGSKKPIAMVVPENGDWDNAQIIPLSISHDGGFATAMCMAYESSPDAVFETADEMVQAIPSPEEESEGSNNTPNSLRNWIVSVENIASEATKKDFWAGAGGVPGGFVKPITRKEVVDGSLRSAFIAFPTEQQALTFVQERNNTLMHGKQIHCRLEAGEGQISPRAVIVQNVPPDVLAKGVAKHLYNFLDKDTAKPVAFRTEPDRVQSQSGLRSCVEVYFLTAEDARNAAQKGDCTVLKGNKIRCVLPSAVSPEKLSPCSGSDEAYD